MLILPDEDSYPAYNVFGYGNRWRKISIIVDTNQLSCNVAPNLWTRKIYKPLDRFPSQPKYRLPITDVEYVYSGTITYIISKSNNGASHIRPYNRVTHEDKDAIVQALKYCKGNKTYAAKKPGLIPRQLHYCLEKLKIDQWAACNASNPFSLNKIYNFLI